MHIPYLIAEVVDKPPPFFFVVAGIRELSLRTKMFSRNKRKGDK